ncbi:MAG: hypothetical protein IKS07_00355 [Lachnospiraceae bacterium]|nr:hypothetical protein [Lachnospiraceae bacterium]MCR5476869.1 hypothetical protein [Lachnospiraceae bacterium]
MTILMLALMIWIIAGCCRFAVRAGFGLARLLVRLTLVILGIAMIGVLITVIRFLPVVLLVLLGCWIFRSAARTA